MGVGVLCGLLGKTYANQRVMEDWGLEIAIEPEFSCWASIKLRGTRWKIGRGKTITIGHHTWLLDDTNGFIQTDLPEEVCRKQLATSLRQQHDLSSSDSGDSVVRSKLWRLNIASKCKIFMWRALLNILPTRVNLVTKKEQLRFGIMLICLICYVTVRSDGVC
ncbi:conserved hypothetical protein [Ricinus communis]|uniref:Reverse transcriptase zinc-binding domain-containing protein n=1 Tax=Ricinus communis TaxID=3988 RepID=B9S3U0_RICCO|nr:conserved hypothetical protein [Ricinus communis]